MIFVSVHSFLLELLHLFFFESKLFFIMRMYGFRRSNSFLSVLPVKHPASAAVYQTENTLHRIIFLLSFRVTSNLIRKGFMLLKLFFASSILALTFILGQWRWFLVAPRYMKEDNCSTSFPLILNAALFSIFENPFDLV